MPEDDSSQPAQRDVPAQSAPADVPVASAADAHAERLSPAAAHRGHRTIAVSDVFAAHADEIAAAVAHLHIRHVLVAVVDAEHEFAGLHEVPETNLIERVKELEFPDGWAMVFSPGASAEHVRTRTTEMAALARKRIAAIERINARRA